MSLKVFSCIWLDSWMYVMFSVKVSLFCDKYIVMRPFFFNCLFIVALSARSYRDCHLLGMRNIRRTLGVRFHCHLFGYLRSEIIHFVNNNRFRSCETLNLYICSGIWGAIRHLFLKITNSLVIFRLRKPLKTSTRLAGHGIWTRELPNANLVLYHGSTSLGYATFLNFANV